MRSYLGLLTGLVIGGFQHYMITRAIKTIPIHPEKLKSVHYSNNKDPTSLSHSRK